MIEFNSLKKLLLVDAFGALATAILISQIIARNETVFGLPSHACHTLAAIACVYFIVSSIGSQLNRSKQLLFLKIIIVANSIYCLITLSVLFNYRSEITLWGVGYFVSELLIIMSLVFFEWKAYIRHSE